MKGRHLVALLLVLAVIGSLAAVFLVSDSGTPPVTPTPVQKTDTASGDEEADAGDTATEPVRRTGRRHSVDVATPYTHAGDGSLIGILREYGSDRPLAGVAISLVTDGIGPNETRSAMTAEDGSFAFADVPNFDNWEFQAAAPAPLADTRMAGVEVVENRQTDVGVIYLSPAFTVEGTVKDESGKPIVGALVRAVRQSSEGGGTDFFSLLGGLGYEPSAVDQATTDTGGRYALERVPTGTYNMLVSADGFRTGVVDGVIVNPDQRDRRLDFVLSMGLSIRGRVVRKSPGPLEGLTVLAFPQPNGPGGFRILGKTFSKTDAEGRFELGGLTAGEIVVAVAPEGAPVTMQDNIDVPTDEEVVLTLEGDAWLIGQITDDEGGPIDGAEILFVMDGKGSPSFASTRTDAEGNYRIDGISSGRPEGFVVRADGFSGYPENPLLAFRGNRDKWEVTPGENRKDVQLTRGATVAGTIVAADGEAPLPGVRVSLVSMASIFGGTRSATTGSDGTFELTGVATGPAVISLSKDGWYQPDNSQQLMMTTLGGMRRGNENVEPDTGEGPKISVTEAGVRIERRLTMATGLELRGTVLTPGGEPVAGAEVTIGPTGGMRQLSGMMSMLATPGLKPRLTDAAGTFRFPGVRPDQPVAASVRAAGYIVTQSDEISASGDEFPPVEVRLKIGATLTGTVLDQAGEPVVGATLTVQPVERSPNAVSFGREQRYPTGADGRFTIPNLDPALVKVTAQHARYLEGSQEVQLADETTTEVDLRLELGKVISGKILDHEQKPAGGARVRLQSVGGPGTQRVWRNAEAGGDGAFEITGLPPGNYTLTAMLKGSAPSEETAVAADTQGVTLRLRQAFGITGIVRFRGGEPAANAQVRAQRDGGGSNAYAQSGKDGAFELEGLVEGGYAIEVTRGNAWGGNVRPNLIRTTRSGVAAGSQDIVIEVQRGAEIRGRVTLGDSTPATEGWVTVQPELPDDSDPEVQQELRNAANDARAQVIDGAFSLEGLPRGSYRVTVRVGNQSEAVSAETGDLGLDIRFPPTGTVAGVVKMPDGSPAENAYVRMTRTDADQSGRAAARCNDKGEFSQPGIGAGTYTLSVSMRRGDQRYVGELKDVVVAPNGLADGFTITLAPSGD